MAKTQTYAVTRGLFDHHGDWKTVLGNDVNDPPSILFMSSAHPDGSMLVTNALDKDWGGGLVSLKLPVPRQPDGTFYVYGALQLQFLFPGAVWHNFARHEIDLKTCIKGSPDPNTQIPNICDWSTQWNRDTGQFQIDKAGGGWIDSGFIVPPDEMTPDEWHEQSYRFWFDPDRGIFSVLSIRFDDRRYEIPEELQNVPLLASNWSEISAYQIQNEGFKPGSTLVQYRNGFAAWSNEPIDEWAFA
jgi:hypothetical protein